MNGIVLVNGAVLDTNGAGQNIEFEGRDNL